MTWYLDLDIDMIGAPSSGTYLYTLGPFSSEDYAITERQSVGNWIGDGSTLALTRNDRENTQDLIKTTQVARVQTSVYPDLPRSAVWTAQRA